MPYIPFDLAQTVRIRRLFSLHYFRFASGYVFPGEKHNFWEMVYIDKGEADIGAGNRMVRLSQGQVIFHKPNEFHSIWANYATAPNIMVVTFATSSPCMKDLRGYYGTLDKAQRRILQQLVDEAERCFGPVLDGTDRLCSLDTAPFGSQQLLGNYLEQFIIQLLRNTPQQASAQLPTQEHEAVEVLDHLLPYMRAHLDGSLRFEDILREAGVGQTALKALFREHMNMGVMDCYQRLRLEEARRLLRSGRLNITQTAEALGYPDIHAFSRQFTQKLGMTPSSYLRSVRA